MLEKYNIPVENSQSPLACYNLLNDYKTGKKNLSVQFCRELLSSTNNPKIVSELLALIEQNLQKGPAGYMNWRPILLGIMQNRVQPEKIALKISKIQQEYMDNALPAIDDYALGMLLAAQLKQDMPAKVAKLAECLPAKEMSAVQRYFRLQPIRQKQDEILRQAKEKAKDGWSYISEQAINMVICNTDFSPYQRAEISAMVGIFELKRCQNFPQANNLEKLEKLKWFSLVDTAYNGNVLRLPVSVTDIAFDNASGFSEHLDFSDLTNLNRLIIKNTDFTGVKGIFLPQGGYLASLIIEQAASLPKSIGLSALSEVAYFSVDRSFFRIPNRTMPERVKKLVVRKYESSQSVLDLNSIREAGEIQFDECSFGRLKEVKFPEKVRSLIFINCNELPEVLNLNIKGLENIDFQMSNKYGSLRKLILPEHMKGKKIKLPPNNGDIKIYYGEKSAPLMSQILNKAKAKFFG